MGVGVIPEVSNFMRCFFKLDVKTAFRMVELTEERTLLFDSVSEVRKMFQDFPFRI